MKLCLFAVLLLVCPAAARADIIAWQDADGVTHYTNLQGEVPQAQRDRAQVVVDELARRPQGAEAPQPADERRQTTEEPRHEAQVIYDRSRVADAYLEGLQRGLEVARGGEGGGNVQINGPLAIANTAAPAAAYLPPYYAPLVTTSFDRGRSRHQTLRMLLQDQFAFDREGPFVFEERFVPPFGHIPLSVELNPFLPRGLPHAPPCHTRVITR